jgi:ribose transport system ATP-binding protein
MPDSSPLLEARRLSKGFPGVRALEGVSLCLGRGEVLAVIGENGAGKSTLMKVLAGIQAPDAGEVLVDGRHVRFAGVQDALEAGVCLIHQELNLADNLDVAANIFLGREPRRLGFLLKRRLASEATRWLTEVGLDVDPGTLVGGLPIARQQLVEIAKALCTRARVLIMDEPTSSLSQRETANLFRVVKDLRSRGVSVIYISHRLGEVREVADRVVVLRDGRNAGELPRDQITHDAMVRLMVGRDISQYHQRTPHTPGDSVLRVRGLRTHAFPRQALSFEVRAGEIVGLAGLVGAGRTELLTTLFGVTPALGGEVELNGRPINPRSPRQAIDAGVALVPEDRKLHGLVLDFAVRPNLSLASLCRSHRAGFLNARAERSLSGQMIPALRIKTPSDRQVSRYLSGGNQQKVVLGKWLAMKPRLLLLDEPTRGIDVGAKEEIYRLMHELAGRGLAILFASSEMEEVLSLSDRALVMHEGRISGELTRDRLDEESVMHLATGSDPLGTPPQAGHYL